MKDPAVLFYFQDFLVGTEFMTDDEVGKYIRILCHQADKGALCLDKLKRICRSEVPEAIMEKLSHDENGNYYQKRMQLEREKRVSYSESRRNNRTKKEDNICKTYDKHMENENININIDINKNEDIIKKREIKFKSEVFEYLEKYSEEMLNKFCNYWTELNKSKTKMRFELERVFEISKRLATWSSRDNNFKKTTNTSEIDLILEEARKKINDGK